MSKFIFLHIEKAGGSTLHNILANFYNSSEVLHLEYMSNGERELKALDVSKLKLVKGHVVFGAHQYLGADWKYYSMLRNPIDRAISYYYYVRQKKSHHHSKLIAEKNWDMSTYIREAQNLQMDNGQLRYISGSDKPFGKVDESDLKLAISNIENHFLAVGLTERFDESLIVLYNLLGWHRYPVYEKANVNKNRQKEQNLSKDDMKLIEDMNYYDLKLYDYVKQRFGNEIPVKQLEKGMSGLSRATSIYKIKKNIKQVISPGKK